MNPSRSVQPETLDHLAEDDPRAVRSRADLRRIHRIMGTRSIMLRALRNSVAPRRVIELGAGDGTLMLTLAKQLADHWPQVHLTLLDRQSLIAPGTIGAFHALGWHLDIVNADVLDWIKRPASGRYDLVATNLFVHHFDDVQLASLLPAIAERTNAFFACEPRRGRLALVGSQLIGLIGANAVTRGDAVLSVRAGFTDNELTALWPQAGSGWHLREYAAGLFSHCFLALRQGE
jgi:2-polyprenyl-3-methyl-5-hydroxy-6-metoxy-1,4-benzoquinol methylase